MADITLRVNGATRTGSPEARKTLADFLRDDLDLTGTHVGCEHGVCGACTVIVDGRAVRSCLMLAVRPAAGDDGRGLAPDGGLGPLQQAMWDSHSFQCGFCTPGFVMQATAFLSDHPDSRRAADPRGAVRQHLPVHWLPEHHRRRPAGRPANEHCAP
jgi:carbon-monoxide dehydrogenase small subunit